MKEVATWKVGSDERTVVRCDDRSEKSGCGMKAEAKKRCRQSPKCGTRKWKQLDLDGKKHKHRFEMVVSRFIMTRSDCSRRAELVGRLADDQIEWRHQITARIM